MAAIQRLRTSGDIRRVMQKGFLTRSPFFIARSTGGGEAPALAIVASKKRVGAAVQRNRVRRRIRAAAHESGLPNGNHVVIAHASAADAPFADLVEHLGKVGRR